MRVLVAIQVKLLLPSRTARADRGIFVKLSNESFDCVNMPLITAVSVVHDCLSLLSITAYFSFFRYDLDFLYYYTVLLDILHT